MLSQSSKTFAIRSFFCEKWLLVSCNTVNDNNQTFLCQLIKRNG
ncbi:hypothetical protein CLOSYM_00537 [[Clostridium] symbiosum ATCC 14940]|uniref:Uncharacterized protein n=1 Tax=[Clostridium] symbiosum ATCC 14940 TaxID=411472 RepID=A0ABC9U2W2_CLOSY|nr:hypothetical protein CLOSYM_00537 [[Clostridium] symbiosum ATCC 14940]